MREIVHTYIWQNLVCLPKDYNDSEALIRETLELYYKKTQASNSSLLTKTVPIDSQQISIMSN